MEYRDSLQSIITRMKAAALLMWAAPMVVVLAVGVPAIVTSGNKMTMLFVVFGLLIVSCIIGYLAQLQISNQAPLYQALINADFKTERPATMPWQPDKRMSPKE
jgi:hypothetical protein